MLAAGPGGLGHAWSRDTGHTVSEENVEFIRNLFAGASTLDKKALLDALPALIPQVTQPDVEWVEDPSRADGRVYRGHEGVLASSRIAAGTTTSDGWPCSPRAQVGPISRRHGCPPFAVPACSRPGESCPVAHDRTPH